MRIGTDAGLMAPATTVLDPAPGATRSSGERRARRDGGSGAPGARRLRLGWVGLALPCAVALFLGLYELSTRSLWLDEGATVSIASQHGGLLWRAIAHDGGNMLVYYLLIHVLIGSFGDAAAVIRMPSVISTVLTVAFTWLIGRRLFDRRLAFAAAMLTAVSLPLVFWGQDARGYAPLVTCCAASFWCFIEVVLSERDGAWWWLVGYVLSTVLGCYMGFVAILVVPAQFLLLGFHRHHVRRLVGSMLVIGVACIPLLVLASARGTSQLFWVPRPNMEGLGQTARWFMSAGMPPNFHATATGTPLLVVTSVVLFAALVVILRRFVAAWRRRAVYLETWSAMLVLSWGLVPIALSLGESAAGQPILLFRNAVICLPAVGLALAWVLLRTRVPVRLGWVLVGALLVLRALQLAPSYGVSPENWKAAESFVSSHVRPGDCIAFYPLDARMPFDYYVRSQVKASGTLEAEGIRVRLPRPVEPAKIPWSETPPYVERYNTPSNSQINHIEKTCRRLWFVASHVGQAKGPPVSRVNFIRYRVLGATLQLGYAHHMRRDFGWASKIEVELLSGRQKPS